MKREGREMGTEGKKMKREGRETRIGGKKRGVWMNGMKMQR